MLGGRRNLFEWLRLLASKRGIDLLIHDGGIEDNNHFCPVWSAKSSPRSFPIASSRAAAGMVKRLCRENGKPFVPLRSASLA